MLFHMFAGFGLGLTATKYVAEYRSLDPAKAGRILGLSSVVAWASGSIAAFSLFLVAPVVAGTVLHDESLRAALRVSSPLILLGAVNGAQLGALGGFEDFKGVAIVNSLTYMLSVPLQVIGARVANVEGAFCGQLLAVACGCIASFVLISKRAKSFGIAVSFRGAKLEKGILGRFTLPAIISSFLVVPVDWACLVLLIRQGGGFAEMASYAAANQWKSAVTFLPVIVGSISLPIFAGMVTDRRFKRTVLKFMALNYIMAVSVAFVLFFGRSLILGLYGRDFVDATSVLCILLVAAVLESGNEILFRALLALDRGWLRLVSNGLRATLILGLSVVLIPRCGAVGLACAVVLAYMAHIAVQLFLFLMGVPRENATNTKDRYGIKNPQTLPIGSGALDDVQ